MPLAINRDHPATTGADIPALPIGMRHMQAAPGAIREDEENDVLIIPLVAIREGVFQCATCPTPELYLAENFGRLPDTWNDRMVTIGHPRVNGHFVSAGTTGIWEQNGIGRIKNARLENKKLKVEAHIDMVKVAELGSTAIDLIERIRRGEPIDVSIGAFNKTVQQFGAHEGKTFSAVQTDYIPDHVAILPLGVKGACSWKDGCGAPRVNAACGCGGDGACQCGDTPSMNELTTDQLLAALQQLLTKGSLPGSAAPQLADSQIGDRTRREMLHTALVAKERGFFSIVQVFDDHVVYRNEREKLLRRDFSIDEATGTVTLSDDTIEGTLISEFMPITVQEKPTMQRNEAVTQLIVAEGTDWAETDRAFLMGVDDAQFAKLAPSQEAADATTNPPTDGGTEPAVSAAPTTADQSQAGPATETPAPAVAQVQPQEITVQGYIEAAPGPIREWLGEGLATLEKARTGLISQLTANQGCPFTAAQLQDMRTEQLRGLVQLAGTAAPASSYAGQAPVSASSVGVPASYKALPAAPAWPTK